MRFASSSSGTASSGSRRSLYLGGAAALAATAALGASLVDTAHAEAAKQGVLGDVQPHPLWTPPTRAQMIAALKASSAAALRPEASRTPSDNASLEKLASEGKSSTPSPAARKDSKGVAMGRDGDEEGEGFDLLIVGGGATGTGVAVDAVTRGLSVAMVERDDFGAGECWI